jgi:hypothetical protein
LIESDCVSPVAISLKSAFTAAEDIVVFGENAPLASVNTPLLFLGISAPPFGAGA